jgi:hypothetical protein
MKSFIIIFIIFPLLGFSQSRWTNSYHENESVNSVFLIESYDNGYIMLIKHHDNDYYGWIIKTDINGHILWEKRVGDENSYVEIYDLSSNPSGEIFLSGFKANYGEYSDPMILKLNACGEKEWCNVYFAPDNSDHATQVIATEDGGCAALYMSVGDFGNNWLCMSKYSSEGEVLWMNCYNSLDTNILESEAKHLLKVTDDGYLISGVCWYRNPILPYVYEPKPYYIKTDQEGNFQWESVAFKTDGSENMGSAYSTVQNPTHSYYYSAIGHLIGGLAHSIAALVRIDNNGIIESILDIQMDTLNSRLDCAAFINDSTLAVCGGWGNDITEITGYALILDTLGNVKSSQELEQRTYNRWFQTTFNEKLIFLYDNFESPLYHVYLQKLNQDLTDDSLSTYPFIYDSLCPFPIISDTISLGDCSLILGLKESESSKSLNTLDMLLYPNPVSDILNCQFSQIDGICSISIYDILGREQINHIVPKDQSKISLNVSSLTNGIYIAVLKSNTRILSKKKFIIIR